MLTIPEGLQNSPMCPSPQAESIEQAYFAQEASVAFVQQDGHRLLWVKFAFEYVLSLVLLILAIPVILCCALLVRLTSRGPAFYSQVRVGLRGKPFRIYKLRTMYHECELRSGPQWSTKGDPRVTPLGRFLRSTHLDELPQLWNILRGEMSLVGPRPERPEFVPMLAQAIPCYEMRLLVRPGVTGLAQVQLPPDTDLASVRLKLAYDLFYVFHGNMLVDFLILLATAGKVCGFSFDSLRSSLRLPRRAEVEGQYARSQALRGELQVQAN